MKHLLILFLAVTVLNPASAHADICDQLTKLLADDGAQDDEFGRSVSISGTTAIIGAYLDDDNGTNSGSAYLFNIATGMQIAKLLPNDGTSGDKFGISVTISDTTAILGAMWDDDNGHDSGSAYVFDIGDLNNPVQIAKLLADDGAVGDQFGISVAISKTIVIVGARRDDDNGEDSGSAYLFDTTPCHCDLNGDGMIGTGDLLVLLGFWGIDPDGPPDFDGDGIVGTSDLLILFANWGPCP